MKRLALAAALLGLSTAVSALASEPARVGTGLQAAVPSADQNPVALSDEQLDAVSGGDLFGDLLNLTSNLNIGTVSNVIGDVQDVIAHVGQLPGFLQGLVPQQTQIIIGHTP